MIFFFVGGLKQQLRQVLRSNAGRCSTCYSNADLVDYDKVLKIFFVPVWRWPGKFPVMYCRNCKLFFPRSYSRPPPGSGSVTPSLAKSAVLRCQYCDRVAKPDFSFCPFCGSTL